ncbi:MAG: hypothetical protein WD941_06300 [Opitutus sp.]
MALPSAFGAAATKGKSDLLPPGRRKETVDKAAWLTRTPEVAVLPEGTELPLPFNPPGFDRPDPGEARPAAGAETAAPAAAPAGPTGNLEILEMLAARLVPSGTLVMGGAPQLVIGKNRFPVGTRFTVTYNNEDYELELVSIDRTTFTLRYRGEETTRPIKPVR